MRRTLWQVFAVPLALLGLTLAALVVGLLAEGWADAAAIAGLAVPLLTIAGYLVRRRALPSAPSPDR